MKKLILLIVVCALFVFTGRVFANHSWGNYHWARTSNPFTLYLGDNVSSSWDAYLQTSSSDWSQSTVMNTNVVQGLSNPKNCKASPGRVEVCNSKYGNNGWLGLAQIWVNGDHIVQGVTKLNDTYFNTRTYNTPAWRQMVVCQELGHTFGLDHQDDIFNNPNLGTCMDYTNDPTRNDGAGNNEHPNAHDYEELGIIYSHLDSFTTIDTSTGTSGGGGGNGHGHGGKPSFVDFLTDSPSEWGRSIRDNGFTALFEKDLGNNQKLFTFVIWAR